jgi:GTP-binding protein HflX
VKTLGYEVIGTMSQKRDELDGATVLGKGRLEELAAITGGTGVVGSKAISQKSKARERFEGADEKKPDAPQFEPDPESRPKPEFVIVDHEISPSQTRNLERATGAQVLDRTGVIMEIFHRHAHSREARLQVEIARLKYVSPRLRESSAGGGRQQGSGAGESDLDLDRRKIRDRIAELKEQLEDIRRENDQRRSARRDQLRVALVGYTNAGKSSLMRALTGSEVLVADKLFATLDTTVRALKPETKPRMLVSDTVGFIKKLPRTVPRGWGAQVPFALFRCVRAAAKDRRGAPGWVPAPFLHRHHAVAVRLPFERPRAQQPYCVAPFAFGPMFGIKHSSPREPLFQEYLPPVYLRPLRMIVLSFRSSDSRFPSRLLPR